MADRIICYGDVIDDIVVMPHEPIRLDTDTPSMIRARPGGSAANTAAWLGVINADVDFIGVVGAGDAPRHVAALPGVYARLREHPELQTGRIVVVVQDERRDMLTDRGANVDLDPNDVPDAFLQRASILHFTGHILLNHAGIAGVRTLIERCWAAGVLVSVSPGSAGFLADTGIERARAAFAGADLIFTGYEDGALLSGSTEAEDVARILSGSFGVAVVTQGKDAISVGERGNVRSFVVEPRPVVDPTGAGDAFCARFLSSWLSGRDICRAVDVGAGLAAAAVEVIGGRPPRTRLPAAKRFSREAGAP
ncbi:MAG: hypothetical protein KC438_06805 [Thermomicrobiales bacterium]|nr:hypothetical protein [Thermomicrobiales bacterium]